MGKKDFLKATWKVFKHLIVYPPTCSMSVLLLQIEKEMDRAKGFEIAENVHLSP